MDGAFCRLTLLTYVAQWKFVVNFRQFNYLVIFASQPYRRSSVILRSETNIHLVSGSFINAVCDACMCKLPEQVTELLLGQVIIMVYRIDQSIISTPNLLECRTEIPLGTNICVLFKINAFRPQRMETRAQRLGFREGNVS